jgi:hypothetical protein
VPMDGPSVGLGTGATSGSGRKGYS